MVAPEGSRPNHCNPQRSRIRHYFSTGASTASRQRAYSSSRCVTWSSPFGEVGRPNPVDPEDLLPTLACDATNLSRSSAISSVRRAVLMDSMKCFLSFLSADVNGPRAMHANKPPHPDRYSDDRLLLRQQTDGGPCGIFLRRSDDIPPQ